MPLSLLDHYRSGSFSPFVREVRPAAGLAMLDVVQPPGDFSDPPVEDLVLVDNRSRYRATCDFGAGRRRYRAETGVLAVVPPNVPTSIMVDDPHRIRVIAFSPATVRGLLPDIVAGGGLDVEPLSARAFRNPVIEALSSRLWEEAREPAGIGGLYAEVGAQMLLLELAAATGRAIRPVRSGLAPWQVAMVKELLTADLEGRVGLADAAAEIGVSAEHLCRAFRASEGVPPHRWLLHHRLDEARRMLLDGGARVVDVALAVGFSDPGRFAAAFRRRFGSTPSECRRDRN